MTRRLDFRLLGPLEVLDGARSLPLGGRKQRDLLALLLLHANEVVSSDALIDGLWGERAAEDGARRRSRSTSPSCASCSRARAPGDTRARATSCASSRRSSTSPASSGSATRRAGWSRRRPRPRSPRRSRSGADVRSPTSRTTTSPSPRSPASRSCAWLALEQRIEAELAARPARRARRRARGARRRAPAARAPARTADPRPLPLRPPGGGARGLPAGAADARRGARDRARRRR